MQENEIINFTRGDAFSVVFEVTGRDFTGLKVKSDFRQDIDQAVADMSFSTDAGSITIEVVSPTVARLSYYKSATDMASIADGTYLYDIEVYTAAADKQTICSGKLKIFKDVTR